MSETSAGQSGPEHPGYVIVDRDGQPLPVERISEHGCVLWIRKPRDEVAAPTQEKPHE